MPSQTAGYAMRTVRRLARLRVFRRFARHKGGAAAVEFGIVAAPFLALMFAIMETALVFFAGQTLETAVADSARLIMTGQAQSRLDAEGKPQPYTQEEFKQAVCSRIYALFDCTGGLKIDVRAYSTFSSAVVTSPVDAQGKLIEDFQYNPGTAGDIVVVRAMYEWPAASMSLLGFSLSNLSNGKRLIMATSSFRNEPYQ